MLPPPRESDSIFLAEPFEPWLATSILGERTSQCISVFKNYIHNSKKSQVFLGEIMACFPLLIHRIWLISFGYMPTWENRNPLRRGCQLERGESVDIFLRGHVGAHVGAKVFQPGNLVLYELLWITSLTEVRWAEMSLHPLKTAVFEKKHLHNLVQWACSFLNNDAFGQSPNQPSFSGATTLAEVKLACLPVLHYSSSRKSGLFSSKTCWFVGPQNGERTFFLWQGWLLGREGQCTFAIVLQAAGGLFWCVVAVLAVEMETPISEDLDLSAVKIHDAVWPNSTEPWDEMSAKVTEMWSKDNFQFR